MASGRFVDAFDARFAALRYPIDPAVLARSFTPDEVKQYILAKAQRRDDVSYPYQGILGGFPASGGTA